jgi:hypothetical protein
MSRSWVMFFMATPPYDGELPISRNDFESAVFRMVCMPCFHGFHQRLGWLGVLRSFDLVDFPGSVIGSAEAGDGEFALVADLVECVLPLGDGVEKFFQAGRCAPSIPGAVGVQGG